jgi:hypothetical protein
MSDYTFETEYWGDCCNTFDEDQKHYIYGLYMGLDRVGYSFDVHGRSIIDIGGGPTSMLLKTKNLGKALVVDPLFYPQWIYARYDAKGINYSVIRGEDLIRDGFDECWIYNCLQHTDDPAKIIANGLRAARTLRIFEWVDIPAHEGHPQEITKKLLDDAIGNEGKLVHLSEAGCFGLAYFNTYTQ